MDRTASEESAPENGTSENSNTAPTVPPVELLSSEEANHQATAIIWLGEQRVAREADGSTQLSLDVAPPSLKDGTLTKDKTPVSSTF